MAYGHEMENFSEGSKVGALNEDVWKTLAVEAVSNGFDFAGMVKAGGRIAAESAVNSFGKGSLSLTDGDDVLAAGRIRI